MRFMGEGGNYLHLSEEEMKPVMAEAAAIGAPTEEELMEEQTEASQQKQAKRNENLKRLFDGLKGKFMSFFEEVEDQEME